MLLKCPKSRVSQHLWTVKMLKCPKHFKNLYCTIFLKFFDHSETKNAPKILFYYFLKSWDCLLTYWHPLTSIVSQSKRVFNSTNSNAIIFKWKNIFWIFLCISGIYIKSEILWKKRWVSENIFFWNYRLQKAGLLKCQKSRVSEHLWTVIMLKGPKHFIDLDASVFVIFLDHSERKSARKNLF